MPYDELLASRIRDELVAHAGLSERKMFGGIAFMLNGNMCCGVVGDELMLRLGEEGASEALAERHTREMDFTGRAMKSMIYVEPQGCQTAEALSMWVGRAARYAASLPPKQGAPSP